jgi:hypothetical protein
MPEGIPYASTNVIAGTGLELNYMGEHCFAYSGSSNPGTGPTTYLLFTTGNQYIVGKFEMNGDFAGGGGNYMNVTIYFNSVKIIHEQDIANNYLAGDNEYEVIIPPYTVVQVDLGGASVPMNINFIGKLYKA